MSEKILLVDDSALSRRSARGLLEGMGFAVEEATDSYQALERFKIAPPDVVIIALMISGLHGTHLLWKILQMDPEARAIVVTADDHEATASLVKSLGAKALLKKTALNNHLPGAVLSALNGEDWWESDVG
jgi:two-component system chemotaxis response regulator CheY